MTPQFQALLTWIYRGPSLVLTALIVLLVLRFVLVLLAGGTSRLVPGVLRNVTNPVARAVRSVTPAVVPDTLVLALGAVWLTAVRVLWLYACIAAGFRPSLGG